MVEVSNHFFFFFKLHTVFQKATYRSLQHLAPFLFIFNFLRRGGGGGAFGSLQ